LGSYQKIPVFKFFFENPLLSKADWIDLLAIVKKLFQIGVSFFLLGIITLQAQATFTSLYVFGDGTCTTTNRATTDSYYYGKRYTNGRTWLEVLAQRLGLSANSITNINWSDSSNNWSYYGQYSSNLVKNLKNFTTPSDAGTALFVVWVCDADSVYDMEYVYPSTNSTVWNNAINRSLTNHWHIITNLYYAKGARTLVMPNAVDITEVPAFAGLMISAPAARSFIRQEMINFNIEFSALLNQARASLPGITIYEPDYFSMVDNMLTNAAAYGLTNALLNGVSTYAVYSGTGSMTNLNGPGTNYIFWDQSDPTAKVHEILADTALQMIAPVQFSQISVLSCCTAPTCTNLLSIVNVPVGLNGFVDGTTNVGQAGWTWTTVTNIASTNPIQSIVVNVPPLPPIQSAGGFSLPPVAAGLGSAYPEASSTQGTPTNSPSIWQSFRLRFPYAWSWP
jgi:phospholipase/lecithinase/hemolysin